MPDLKRIWVVHGRNLAARDAMFQFLQSIGLEPIEWGQAVAWTKEGAAYIREVLDRGFSGAHAVLVLLTGDEIAYLRPQFGTADEIEEMTPAPQARPNVLFEAGMGFALYPESHHARNAQSHPSFQRCARQPFGQDK